MWAMPQFPRYDPAGNLLLQRDITGNNLLLFAPFLFGMWLLFRQGRTLESERRSLLLPLFLILQPALWAWAGGYRPPEYQCQRYVAHLDALYLLVGLYGGWWMTERLATLRKPLPRGVCLVAVLAVSLALQPQAVALYARNVKNITEMQVTIARWLRDNTPPGSLLAVNDVGAIGVLADRPVLDLQGLVSPEALAPRAAARREAEATGQWPTALAEFVFSRRPDYVVIFPQRNWYPELDARRDLLTPVFGVELRDNVTCGAPTMIVYRSKWAGERHARASHK